MADSISVRALAGELNVSLDMVRDFIRAGHLELDGGKVTAESADNLRWHLALAKACAGDTVASRDF